MRILLADDEESLRMTLAANLELHGHEVIEACDGREAVALLHRHEVDLVLSDIRMPHLDGLAVLAQVRGAHPGTPVVLMTAYTAEAQVDAAIAGGVYAVLRKPFDITDALPALTHAANGSVVLVVDDERVDTAHLAEILRSAGVLAEVVADPETAVGIARSGRVDVCVMGVENVTSLRELSPSIPIIVVTSDNGDRLMRHIADRGVYAVMKSPVEARDLLHTVARARGGRETL
jgi:DNA-binding NtrC family response regulator